MKINQLLSISEAASRVPKRVVPPSTSSGATSTPNLTLMPGGLSSNNPQSSSLTNFGSVGAARSQGQQAANVAANYNASLAAGRRATVPSTQTTTPSSATTGATSTTPTPSATTAAQPSKLGQVAKAVGKAGLSGLKAVGRAAPGVIGAVGNIGSSAVQAAGNIAAQGASGLTQTLGAAGGGLVHGYKTAKAGQPFSALRTSPAANASVASQADQLELDQLKARLDRIEQLLTRRP